MLLTKNTTTTTLYCNFAECASGSTGMRETSKTKETYGNLSCKSIDTALV